MAKKLSWFQFYFPGLLGPSPMSKQETNFFLYSSVPNRRVGQNKRAGGKFLENIKRAGQNKCAG